jgi:SAM-dependent methyltransferase
MEAHDTWAKYYDFVYEQTFGEFYNELTELTTDFIQAFIQENAQIIDFGAGTGRLSIPLAQEGYHVIAIEKSKQMANVIFDKAKEQGIQLDIQNCSISDFKHEGLQADIALAVFTVLTYTTTEQEMKANFKAIWEHLKPGGLFFFDLPGLILFNSGKVSKPDLNRHIVIDKVEGYTYSYHEECSRTMNGERFEYMDEFQIRYWTKDEINDMLKDQGFELVVDEFPEFKGTGADYLLYRKK